LLGPFTAVDIIGVQFNTKQYDVNNIEWKLLNICVRFFYEGGDLLILAWGNISTFNDFHLFITETLNWDTHHFYPLLRFVRSLPWFF